MAPVIVILKPGCLSISIKALKFEYHFAEFLDIRDVIRDSFGPGGHPYQYSIPPNTALLTLSETVAAGFPLYCLSERCIRVPHIGHDREINEDTNGH